MTRLRGATILITGAGGGFGRHLSRQLLAAGGRLLLTDVDAVPLDVTATDLSAVAEHRAEPTGEGPGEVVARLSADLSSPEGCRRLWQQVEDLGEEVDILINNAGIAHFGAFDEVPEDAWQRLMQINLLAPMTLSHLFCRGMIRRRRGHVLNVSSAAGWVASRGLAAYSATKFGLRGFSDSLRHELRPHGVKVTTVYPFFSRTPILEAPVFGALQKPPLPDSLTSDPAVVVRAMVQGIATDREHVFPEPSSRRLHWLVRFFPRLVPWLQGRLEKRLLGKKMTESSAGRAQG